MLRLTLAALTLTLLGGLATADRRDNRRGGDRGGDRRPVIRDHRNDRPQRVNRPAQRPDRRVITRRPVYVNNGRFVFGAGVGRAYVRPVFRTRYYNARVRPQLIVESYGNEPGYIWVRGRWVWGGNEWLWNDGHFEPDPQYSNYYDDGSFDYSVNINIGG